MLTNTREHYLMRTNRRGSILAKEAKASFVARSSTRFLILTNICWFEMCPDKHSLSVEYIRTKCHTQEREN